MSSFTPSAGGAQPVSPQADPQGERRPLRSKTFRPLVAAALTFLLAGAVSIVAVSASERQRVQQQRAQLSILAGEHARAIQSNIERALSATYALGALVRQGNGEIPDFEATATQMLAFYPGAAAFQLAPDGVIRQVVPLAGNEKALGHDLLKDPARSREAFLARDTGKLTLAGPFDLLQGGLGAVGRLPVFLDDARQRFWGFATVLIRFPKALEEARLDELSEIGLAYRLWRPDPAGGAPLVIVQSGPEALAEPVDRSLELPNGTWFLSVAPARGWSDTGGIAARAALALLFSLLLAYAVKLGLESRAHKRELEQRVALRTRELSISEQRIRNISDAAGAYLWEVDSYLVYRHVSGRSADVKGYPPEALLGHTPMEFMPPEDVAEVAGVVERAIEQKSSFRLQHRDITPSGEVWWEEVYGAAFCNDAGDVIGLRGTGMSINARKQAEENLQRSEQRFRDVAEISADWIWEIDAEQRFTYVSEGVRGILGYRPEEVIGKTPFDMMDPDEAASVGAAFAEIAAAKRKFTDLEILLRGTDGTLHVTLTSGTPILDGEGELVGYRGVDRDITTRRKDEKRIRRLTNLYAALSECNQAIVRCTSPGELYDIICEDVVEFGGMRMAWIGLCDDPDGLIRPVARFGEGLAYLDGIRVTSDAADPHGRGPAGTAIREDRPVWNQDFLNDPLSLPWRERASEFGWRSVAALPLHCDGKVIGAFVLYSDETDAFDVEARILLEEMASDISLALDGFERDASIALAAEVFEQGKEGIMITDTAGRIMRINRAFTEISGYSEAEAVGKGASLLSSGRQGKEFYREMWRAIEETGHWQGEIWNRRKDGHVYPEWLAISRVVGAEGRATHYVGIFSDITLHKEAEARIQRLAHYDALTGLPNRALLQDRAQHAIGIAERSDEKLAVLFIDLDHFKNINDTLGHRVGDELLCEVGRRLVAAMRKEDTVSRQGGDEFVVILPGTDADGAVQVSRKLIEMISVGFKVEQYDLVVTPSIGIAMYPSDGRNFDELSKSADTAMYRAKREGRNTFRFFTPMMQEHSARILRLEGALRNALARDEFELRYQPQIALADERIVGAEALLRWHSQELGEVDPAEFIPVAEGSGLILPIGEWVLRTAVRQMKAWIGEGVAPEILAINLSAAQFRHFHLPELVARVLDEEGLAAGRVELELTESVAMDDPLSAAAVMDELHRQGVRMSIDDFGTGYSSLSYLKRFAVYKLKIDQSFVRDISTDTDDRAIVAAVIRLAEGLGIRTIAEGVETAEQAAFLRAQGCHEVQGYFYSAALAPGDFASFIRARG